jgi:hypothetical protein
MSGLKTSQKKFKNLIFGKILPVKEGLLQQATFVPWPAKRSLL